MITSQPTIPGLMVHRITSPTPKGSGEREDASLQAYFEWMPVRDPTPGGSRAELWRHFAFGNLASLITLETRHTGRSEQINYGDYGINKQ